MSFNDLLADLRTIADGSWDKWTSMPPTAYCSQELFELEAEHLFYGGWVLAGRADQILNPGDYMCIDVLDEPIVLCRDRQSKIRALSRVCRHRWMEVCSGHGNTGAFVCPYHAWTYELDGRLRHAPEMQKTEDFAPERIRLPGVRSALWEGFVFVNISGDAEPIEDALHGASKELAGYDLTNWVTVHSIDLGEAPWDWKVFMDNGEIYHHLMLHRETAEPRSPANLAVTGALAEDYFLLYGPASPEILVEASDGKPAMPSYLEQVGGWAPSRLSDRQRTSATYFYPYPNYVVALWVNFGIFFRVMPLAAGRSHLMLDYMVPGEFAHHPDLPAALERATTAFGIVHGEDTVACTAVQRAVRSRFAEPGRLSYLEEHNQAFAQWFAKKITRAVN